MITINKDSLIKHNFHKLLASIISSLIQFIIQSITPRSFESVIYGQFNFLSYSILQKQIMQRIGKKPYSFNSIVSA